MPFNEVHNISILSIFFVVLLALSSATQAGTSLNGFDITDASIPLNEILPGGPPRDGIPSIDKPRFVSKAKVKFLNADDRILGVFYKGIAKAYPIRILNWHEIVNDKYGHESVVVSFCPLCGSGMVFNTTHKKAKTFGVSGLLYNSDLLLYDRETESLWSQIHAKAISGKLKGSNMSMLPIEHTTWKDWSKRYPRTKVLSEDTGYNRDYSRSPYAGYEQSERLYFPVSHADRRYHPKEQVIGVKINEQVKVYPFVELAKRKNKVTDNLGGKEIIIEYSKEHHSARVIDSENNPIPSLMSFWFAWMAFHPDSEVYVAE